MRTLVLILAVAALLGACRQPSETTNCSHEVAGPAGKVSYQYRTEIVFPFAVTKSVRWRPPVVEGSQFDDGDMFWSLVLIYEPRRDGSTGALKQAVWRTSNMDMKREGKAWAGVGVTDRITFSDGTVLTTPSPGNEDYTAMEAFNAKIGQALGARPKVDRVTLERLDAAGTPIIRSVVDISRRPEVDAYARAGMTEVSRLMKEAGLSAPSGPLCNTSSDWKG
jgi:hypothetical protein